MSSILPRAVCTYVRLCNMFVSNTPRSFTFRGGTSCMVQVCQSIIKLSERWSLIIALEWF